MRNLYGPLLACVSASKSAFDAMCHQHSPDGTSKTFIEAIRSNPGGSEGQVYRYAGVARGYQIQLRTALNSLTSLKWHTFLHVWSGAWVPWHSVAGEYRHCWCTLEGARLWRKGPIKAAHTEYCGAAHRLSAQSIWIL